MEELPNGKFKFFERYKDPYTEKWKRISTTLNSGSNRAAKQATEILNDKINKKLAERNKTEMTFIDLYNEWFPYHQKFTKRNSWIKTPKMMVHIKKIIADDVLIANIDESLVQQIVDNMYTFGNLSYNYTKQVKTVLSTMLTYAVKNKYLKVNVALNVQVTPKIADKSNKKKRMEEKYLEPDEAKRLIQHLYSRKKNELHGLISEFLYLNGLRYGELIALQLKNNRGSYVEVHGTLDYTDVKMADAVKTSPKNEGSWRDVDMTDRSKEILDKIELDNYFKHGLKDEDGYYFLSNHGTPLTISSFNEAVKAAAIRVGIKKNVTSHIFRHTHIAVLSEMGIPLEAIMERVGHMDASTTLEIYNHVTKNMKIKLIDRLNKLESFAPHVPLSTKKE
ncbi:tyrosine-type recombinase/integrase [Enterococcus sp.]|uniref:tyrosine-type recombinase/integrase n=1 Tax=Enterococcus sp. TaxID=35783 RepID=UPI002FCAE00C